MSDKAWKRARKGHDKVAEKILIARRIARHCPRWRIILAALGFEGFMRRWSAQWETKTRGQIEHLLKKAEHRKMESIRKHYHMRPGAPVAPKDIQPSEPWPRPPAIEKQEASRG